MKKFMVPLLAAVMVVSMIFTGCVPVTPPPVTPPPVTPPPVTPPPVTPPPVEPPVTPPPVVEEEKLTFAYVTLGDLDNPWIAELYRGWLAATEILGVDSVVAMGDWDYAKTISVIDVVIASGVDGIYVQQWDDTEGVAPSYQRALDLGIKIVVADSYRPSTMTEAEVPHVGLDYFAQGYTCGLWLADTLEAAGVSDTDCVCCMGEITAPGERMRCDGIVAAIKDEGIGVASYEYNAVTNNIAAAVDNTKVYLMAHPEKNVLLTTGAITTPAGAMALAELGIEPGEVFWAGFDLDPETQTGIRAGYGASNVDDVFSYGWYGAISLYVRIKYGCAGGDITIPTSVVDQTNIDEFLD